MNGGVILIEDDKIMRVTLEDALKGAGYEVMSFATGTAGLNAIQNTSCDVVITDVRLPDIDGFAIVREIAGRGDIQVIVMTAYGTIRDAVEAMKLGAFDYLTKPFSLDEFLLLVERALDLKRLKDENIRLRKDLNSYSRAPNIVGESAGMKKIFFLIDKVAASSSTVLLLGESGTGKEMAATTIHYRSARRSKPLIKVNCSTLPEGLIESELFGHEKGAFTGAIKRKPGRFELADGGTIFLDEVGDLPQSTQAKILRVMQERQFERIGGTETLTVDVRVIAATNRDLEKEVGAGRFREDLYYRLNVIPIVLPPLRERKEDIPALIEHFMDKYRKIQSKNVRLSKEAADAILIHDFPGNVRELENTVERCVTLATSGVIGREELPPAIAKGQRARSLLLSDVAAEAEKNHILRVLRTTGGGKSKAAEILGISRKTLWEKINAFGIE